MYVWLNQFIPVACLAACSKLYRIWLSKLFPSTERTDWSCTWNAWMLAAGPVPGVENLCTTFPVGVTEPIYLQRRL